MSIDGKLAEQIEERLKNFVAESKEDPLSLRAHATRFNALPLCVDWGKCWAVRTDGEVIVFTHEEAEPCAEAECDERMRNVALYQGSLTYPELETLVPARPDDAKDCPYCAAKGFDPSSLEEKNIVCYCGGLGWIPASA
ncbi:MAG TPA: hypothetical protein VID27_09465 [Blastocatellia bacterium]|jgi:hypothetical protein